MNQRFTTLDALVAPLDRANVDTDAILPKQFMKSIHRTGFGDALFDGWRYLDPGGPGQGRRERVPNPDFALNQARYQGAQVLLTRENFGCGSSREHACWALRDFGIRALIAPGFADIFKGNCLKNGLLPVVLSNAQVEALFQQVHAPGAGRRVTIDLAAQAVTAPDGTLMRFEIDAHSKQCLLMGLDDIALTLQHQGSIDRYEQRRRVLEPWLFADRPDFEGSAA